MNDLLCKISFHASHPTMPATKIVSEFDVTPRVIHNVGDSRRTPKGTPLEGTYGETYCSFLLREKTTGHLDKHLDDWCDYFEKHAQFLREFVRSGGHLDFYISIFLDGDRGFEIDNRLLQRICAIGFGVMVEMYRLSDKEAAD